MVKNIPFQNTLVLNKFLLNYIGFEDFDDIRRFFSDPVYEGINSEGQTKLFQSYWNRMEQNQNKRIVKDEFAQYDLNIIKHLNTMNSHRDEHITLKYFQYFSLLFVEIYLDNFFANQNKLKNMLNEQIEVQNDSLGLKFVPYELKDLNKLAIWNATGSGKTLLMHINYMQMKHYLKKYKVRFDGSYMLLTPSEALSGQHLEEYVNSGIKANRFDKEASRFFNHPDDIQVIENSKLADKDGEKTVSVHRFGDMNILFVDEGHRGSSGDSWYQYRSQLCESGFSFEYSATFSQAVKANSKKGLEEEYAKCILFDYSYKYFYEDGFGKDYDILNLPEQVEAETQSVYLTASLLSFYQQKRLFADKSNIYVDYNLENPLMVFVGGKVIATTGNKTDIVEIVTFFNDFVSNPHKEIDIIEQIISGDTKLLDSDGRDVFEHRFDYLAIKNMTSEEIYDDLLNLVFHTNYRGQLLHAENLKGIDGEIRLRIGENEPFGVINVGSDVDLLKLITKEGIQTNTIDFATSLFESINDKDSKINILIGSKKFSEGWNSWRVSTMGLMNVGQKEGSQIIQLFGRGVRLKGRNFSLKRSSSYHKDFRFEAKPVQDAFELLPILETLNIFGLRANYMQQFKEYLTSEGLNPDNETMTISIPVRKNVYPKGRLKTMKVKGDLDFMKDGPQPKFSRYIKQSIVLDTYGKVQFESSIDSRADVKNKELGSLSQEHFFGMDFEKIYFDLLEYKKLKKYWNVVFSLDDIKTKLQDTDWYKLYIPKSELKVKSFADFERFTRIGTTLMKKYLDKVYTLSKKNFEAPLLEYVYVDDNDPNFIDEYNVTIENADNHLAIKNLFKQVESFVKEEATTSLINHKVGSQIQAKYVSSSLYNPLFHIDKGLTDIQIVPTALVDSEWEFIHALTNYIDNNKLEFEGKELYLIRNASRKGIGFFEDGGFYPDFIMWYFDGDNDYIVFIEPHGMYHEDLDGNKVKLSKEIKKLEKDIILYDGKRPTLESFILSPTKYAALKNPAEYSKEYLNKQHVIFMEDVDFIKQIFDVLHLQKDLKHDDDGIDESKIMDIDNDDLF
ncbi:DEAD/DEAH box helicase family protein [Priestia megaterium]|uniref:DEAD/DEAH box helicase family protein n=1 Tax=Priestia megaterium TaxID=1404 RepID=UPI00207ABDB6|nr:DEAD/DEAH box helicase family protein [Priestia megaterium]USL27989.1 DEAD/DEAH box helicase family protein [Priestia megaterium]